MRHRSTEPRRWPPAAPDPKAALVLDTRELGRGPGAMVAVHRTVAAPVRIGLDLIAVGADTDLLLDLRLESVVEGVLVSGEVRGEATGECSRCLQPVHQPVAVELTELYAYPDSTTERTTDEDEVRRVVDGLIDLTQAVVDAVGLELPLQPVCAADCPGLCVDCGMRLAIAEPGHRHETIDPRWAGLAAKVDAAGLPETVQQPGPTQQPSTAAGAPNDVKEK